MVKKLRMTYDESFDVRKHRAHQLCRYVSLRAEDKPR